MNWTTTRRWAALVARLVLAVTFLFASWRKLGDPRQFLRAVRAYDATPEFLSKAIAYGLPVLELSLAVLLLVGVATRYAAAVTAALLLVFTVGIAQASARGIKISCGCFGGGGASTSTSYLLDIARDVGLLVLAVYLVVWPVSVLALDQAVTEGHDVTPPSAKRVRRDPRAIQKYRAMQAARQRELRGRQRYIAATAGVMVLLVCLIGISVQASRSKIQGSEVATNANATTGVVVGKATAPITLDVFEDFQCPICQQLETTTGAELATLVTAGTIKVNYHMMAFLDSSSSGNRYSSRASNAALCASDISTAAFGAYHAVLYGKDPNGQAVQPAEGGDGRTDGDFITYLKQALPKATSDQTSAFTSCVTSEQHAGLVQAITDQASKKGVTGTPTVFVDGRKLATATAATVLKAINDKKAAIKTP